MAEGNCSSCLIVNASSIVRPDKRQPGLAALRPLITFRLSRLGGHLSSFFIFAELITLDAITGPPVRESHDLTGEGDTT